MDLTFISPHAESAIEPDFGDGEELRPLDWAGLCAQLAAVQQLRRELARVETAARASFAPVSARQTLGSPRFAPGVNLEPLADGKATRGIDGEGDGEPARENRTRGQQ
ncbi:MAG TPA: hypothetical protein VM055_05405 [Novosphingobium sp.]|nr:hypothetical protein [Novosphingobium sp.]